MVTTRSQSVSPRKKTAKINYAELANPPTPTPTSPRKRSVAPKLSPQKQSTSTATTDSPTKKTPRRKSMAEKAKSIKDEIVVALEETKPVDLPNANGVEKRPQSSSRKRSRSVSGTGETKGRGKPTHKVDTSGKFEFGGTVGTASMMIFFPMLMYYLWICSTFYGGSLQFKRSSETWLAFADRMVAHVTKVALPFSRLTTGSVTNAERMDFLLGIHYCRRSILRHPPRHSSQRTAPSPRSQPSSSLLVQRNLVILRLARSSPWPPLLRGFQTNLPHRSLWFNHVSCHHLRLPYLDRHLRTRHDHQKRA